MNNGSLVISIMYNWEKGNSFFLKSQQLLNGIKKLNAQSNLDSLCSCENVYVYMRGGWMLYLFCILSPLLNHLFVVHHS